LLQHFNELIGQHEVKPFECVGTIDEINMAIKETIKMIDDPLPFLLDYYSSLPLDSISESTSFINLDKTPHYLEKQFLDVLKNHVK
jgi:hypothetical protein